MMTIQYNLSSLGQLTCKKCTVIIGPVSTKETFSTKKFNMFKILKKKTGKNSNSEDILLCKD